MKKIMKLFVAALMLTLTTYVVTHVKGVSNKIEAGSTLAFAYTLVSVHKNGTNPGRSKPKKDKLIIFKMDDVATWPSRDDNGIKITADVILKAGKTAAHLYFTPGTITIGNKSSGNPDAKGYEQQIDFQHPGSALEIEEFLENNLNANLGVIIQYCDSNIVKLAGSLCNPLQMEVDSKDDNKEDISKITLKSVQVGSRVAIYEGTIPALDEESGS